MASTEHFRVSSHLKDIIGRDLVTNEFVAVFELVKNAFDAQAKRVDIAFDLDKNEIWIVDNGKGMDEAAIRERWLFVAYSAKADGSEDAEISGDYRDRIRPQGQFAGSKGIGRFSCDTLGATLQLYSRRKKGAPTQRLDVEWDRFEADSKKLFQTIGVRLQTQPDFPADAPIRLPPGSGTALRIGHLRGSWWPDDITRLRQYLEKLIDPFGTTKDTPVHISVRDKDLDEEQIAELEGPVGNDLRDLLTEKTTRIDVQITNDGIVTSLVDRGLRIYTIREKNEFSGLIGAEVRAEIFYLNRSAKATFTRRMGVRPVEFGSIFLFLNGFRIFPIGEENDDTLGLNRRKQQGSSRYLGTRDIMGRVDVLAPPRMFREASSRDAGLIEDAHSRDLYQAIIRKAVVRLERYVVGVTWQDKTDADRDDASGIQFGETKGRVAQVIAQLAATRDLTLEYFNPVIIEIFDDGQRSLDGAMKALTTIAEKQGDEALLRRIEEARARQAELEEAEREATRAAREALAAKALADARISRLERQARYLASTQDMTVEQMTLLLHQVMIYSGHIGAAIDRALGDANAVLAAAADLLNEHEDDDLQDAAASIRARTRRVIDDLDYIHLENDRLTAVARFASNARFDLETDLLEGDVVEFLDEYVNQVRANRDATANVRFEANGLSQDARFRPVDLVVVVDNMLDNARKHGATIMTLAARQAKGSKKVEITISDDGRGIDETRIDPTKIFEKGYTSTVEGTGLGLFHARKVVEAMGGNLILDPDRAPGRAEFIMTLPSKKA
ncbi:putative two-component histidine kinase [Sphingomonas changbaiensis NBRC 104936]|uniref:histidine kinase n=1 Tax=Sphingomonas changbaiensis NBRC 104936 TaxID=1219043 RepID=A0A0E9MN53_9SPHN|nr:ATP-binding protein [Sphingomonas changbaiensis]GAO39217.1 putative two-component histidine kinase [Sphingomonas changbaiensis NBRC 104936]